MVEKRHPTPQLYADGEMTPGQRNRHAALNKWLGEMTVDLPLITEPSADHPYGVAVVPVSFLSRWLAEQFGDDFHNYAGHFLQYSGVSRISRDELKTSSKNILKYREKEMLAASSANVRGEIKWLLSHAEAKKLLRYVEEAKRRQAIKMGQTIP